jgi:Uncharacterised nucleotidyltransferase/Methyltransferase domain
LAAEQRTGAPEIRLLIACARKNLAAVDVECIRALVPDGVNWPNLMADGLRHDCLWRLNAHLNEVVPDRIPLQWRAELQRSAQQAREADQLSSDEVGRISRLLAADGIAFVPSQVPILGWLAARGLRHNEYADFEFLIWERHTARAAAILESAGYHPRADSRSGAAHQFADENTGVFLTLQTEQTLRGFPVESTIERATGGTIEIEVSGRRIRAISAEDALVHLCVWGAKGYWNQLRGINNVSDLIEEPGVDWDRAMHISQEWRCVRLLLLGAWVAHQVLRTDVSNEILARAEADAHVRGLAGTVVERLIPTEANTRGSGSGARSRARFRVSSRDTYWQGMVHAARLLASPSEMDREMIHAPRNFSRVYAIQRPWRLWREYGIRDRPGADLASFHPTPDAVVDRLLRLAKVVPGDVLYDLGCGDGRIVIRAAKEYGISAVGVDVNPQRISEARANAARCGIEHQVEFRTGDAKTSALGEATVIVLALSAKGNLWLMDRLRGQLRPGARVVSYNHAIAGWPADLEESVTIEDGTTETLYLWHIQSTEIHEKADG